ncbi:MAG: phosphatidate cytidylyltransferase [Lachnospiraceae bacterium]|nr:phosphatidate cytidylyltransferase [Lachnospiraceae bacterium]
MFKTRLLSGVLLLVIALLTIIPGGDILLALIAAISLIGLGELLRVFQTDRSALGVCAYIFAVVYFLSLRFAYLLPENFPPVFALLAMAYVIVLLAIMVFAFPKYKIEQLMASFFGFFYVVVMLSFVYQIRMLPIGVFSVWLIFICSWGSDTFAYCAGMLLGKHKLAPKLSPKKSIEGAVGGVVGAAVLGLLYALAINAWSDTHVAVLLFVIIGAVGSIISQIGDLAASAMKRQYDIKDYGRLIPGHGGILDRFDSVIITAPIIFYFTIIL